MTGPQNAQTALRILTLLQGRRLQPTAPVCLAQFADLQELLAMTLHLRVPREHIKREVVSRTVSRAHHVWKESFPIFMPRARVLTVAQDHTMIR